MAKSDCKTPKKNKSGIGKYWRRALVVIAGLILGLNLYRWNASALAGNSLPMPFGVGMAVVLSGSMEPTLSVNDVIIVREAESYHVNDIVVYDSGREMIVHKIIEQNGDTFITKGDANNVPDAPIRAEAIKGKVVFSIPYAGIAVKALRSPVGMIVVILAAVLLIEGSFRREKENDENRLEEIKAEIRRLREEQEGKD